ncbi:MAG TPA: prepilin-type N-terminal cleavage/methylation domain-containing protein [Myxococcales bacterium]|nr:prepilin-type N-terminal cleavage/methylation domain-containing protein [Myxococcales bacterium]HIK84698.1 prepilin-type N-terminal cleavage/methylation domain-containing protein [Myxococcales bacterium]
MHGVDSSLNKSAFNKKAMRATCRSAGFTLVEAMVVVAIIGIVMASSVPNITRYFENGRGRAAAKSIADALNVARAQAIRTGSNHVVFFSVISAGIPAGDVGGTALTDVSGNPVPIFVLNDGAPGSANQNCLIDAVEERITFPAQNGVGWGANVPPAAIPAPDDDAVIVIPADGSSFRAPDGTPNMTWVQFRPDGVPVGIDAACNAGRLGSGGGTIYLQTANRDFAITLSPLGGVRVHLWDAVTGGWTI